MIGVVDYANPMALKMFSLVVLAISISAPVSSVAQSHETDPASEVVARNVRALARTPNDVGRLIASGRAALQLGDNGAAAGFFGRAIELAPRNASAHAGMASVLLALGKVDAAIGELNRARDLGASPSVIGVDLGLAYDLNGDQPLAEASYRAALNGSNGKEARRRLTLSFAIAGNYSEAIRTLEPLIAADDRAAQRVRAFVLALAGDIEESKAALDQLTPGGGAAAEPFLRQLRFMTRSEKAAALNIGIFPERLSPPGTSEAPDVAAADAYSPSRAEDGQARPMEYGAAEPNAGTAPHRNSGTLALYGVFTTR